MMVWQPREGGWEVTSLGLYKIIIIPTHFSKEPIYWECFQVVVNFNTSLKDQLSMRS